MNEPILSTKDLVVKFSLRGQVLTAIRGASLDLYQGETLAIVGESGSGKSVFTKSWIGMLDANGWIDSGENHIRRQESGRISHRTGMAHHTRQENRNGFQDQ